MRTSPTTMLPLFRSDVQARVLGECFSQPDQRLTVTEIARRTGDAYSTVHREVVRLVNSGVLVEERYGRAFVVRADQAGPYFWPVFGLVSVSVGVVPIVRDGLADLPGVRAAVLFGSFAARLTGEPGPIPRDVDVVVVGGDDSEVYVRCRELERRLRRDIDAVVVTPAAWATGEDPFVAGLHSRPMLTLFDHSG